jgi:hypothetical protein
MAFPSTFADLKSSVITKLRLDATNDAAKVSDWLNQVYADVCVETEASIATTTLNMVAGTSSYTLPTAVMRIKSMYVTPVNGAQLWPLRQTTLDYILRRRVSGGGLSTATGSPTEYALLGLTKLEVYPTPSAADVVTIYHVALPTALSSAGDIPILQEPWGSKLLEYGACAEAADWKGDPSEQEYRQLFEVWKQKFRAHLTRRQGGQPGQFRIFPGGSFPPHDPSTDLGN